MTPLSQTPESSKTQALDAFQPFLNFLPGLHRSLPITRLLHGRLHGG